MQHAHAHATCTCNVHMQHAHATCVACGCGNVMSVSSYNVANDYLLPSPLRDISSLLMRRYSERGFSLPLFWSADRWRKALLRPALLAAKYTASASTRAQASAAFLEDMRAHCLTVSTNGKHHVGRRPNARRSIAAARKFSQDRCADLLTYSDNGGGVKTRDGPRHKFPTEGKDTTVDS